MYGNKIQSQIFGQSHSPTIGVKISGLPKGEIIDIEYIQGMLNRRKSRPSSYSTKRREPDIVKIERGLIDGFLTGEELLAVIENTDIKPKDYSGLLTTPRPSHADYAAVMKYGKDYNASGGGAFSGRMTAAMVIMGGIAKQILARRGITVNAGVSMIGGIECGGYDELNEDTQNHEFYAINEKNNTDIQRVLEVARRDLDSVGGKISCKVEGLKAGLGGEMFGGLEGDIAKGLYGIPAVKGVEFGLGFGFCREYGSKVNDEFYYDSDGNVKTYTNNNGGINGGISNGMPITLQVAIKPTPSIAKEQRTINLVTKENVTLSIHGRHDVCVVPRAAVVVESIVAYAILDRLYEEISK